MALLRARWFQILLVGLALFGAADLVLATTNDVLYFPTIMMIGAFLVPFVFVAYFYRQENVLDRGQHGANVLPTLLLCALFGGLIGTMAAGLLEAKTLSASSLLTLAWVGPIEEFSKMIVPIVLFIVVRRRFASELDGLLFGVAAGMSFAALETMGYELVTLVNSQGSLAALDQTIFLRGLLSPAGHAAWTGLIAATLWRERNRTGKWFTPLVLGFFLIAAALHSLWDFASFSNTIAVVVVSYVAIGGASLTLLIWRFREARRIAVTERVLA